MNAGFGMGFDTFGTIFFIFFFLILGLILYSIIRGIARQEKEKRANDNSPILDVHATIVSKRQDVSSYGSSENGRRVDTTYYVTFQVESGDRLELNVTGTQFGMMIEGDIGMLRFQGTRFLEFKRG